MGYLELKAINAETPRTHNDKRIHHDGHEEKRLAR